MGDVGGMEIRTSISPHIEDALRHLFDQHKIKQTPTEPNPQKGARLMGTNYYWKPSSMPEPLTLPTGVEVSPPRYDRDDPRIHIGKRSAAGAYCWTCHQTLCMDGPEGVHQGSPGATLEERLARRNERWYDRCPTCGQSVGSGEPHNAAVMELGFEQPARAPPKGVISCSSFIWAQSPEEVGVICRQNPDAAIIENEYGDELTGSQFLQMIEANCPISFTDSIGKWFS